jgi:hypothetical protein
VDERGRVSLEEHGWRPRPRPAGARKVGPGLVRRRR